MDTWRERRGGSIETELVPACHRQMQRKMARERAELESICTYVWRLHAASMSCAWYLQSTKLGVDSDEGPF